MKITGCFMALAVICSAVLLNAQDTDASSAGKVLFVYDKVDKGTKLYVEAYRENLKATGLPVEEAAVESTAVTDISPFGTIILYSRVMAFDKKSPVRDWLKKQKDLTGKSVFLFVTANKWMNDKNFQSIMEIVKGLKGNVVDAVSMATAKMSESQKRDAVAKHLEKLTK